MLKNIKPNTRAHLAFCLNFEMMHPFLNFLESSSDIMIDHMLGNVTAEDSFLKMHVHISVLVGKLVDKTKQFMHQ